MIAAQVGRVSNLLEDSPWRLDFLGSPSIGGASLRKISIRIEHACSKVGPGGSEWIRGPPFCCLGVLGCPKSEYGAEAEAVMRIWLLEVVLLARKDSRAERPGRSTRYLTGIRGEVRSGDWLGPILFLCNASINNNFISVIAMLRFKSDPTYLLGPGPRSWIDSGGICAGSSEPSNWADSEFTH